MADYADRTDRFTSVEEQYAGYTVRDPNGEKIGKVDDLFVDANDQPEYFGVKMGFLGTSSTLIPADIATIDNERGFIEVNESKSKVKDGPAFDDDREITSEYEQQVHSYYGLEYTNGSTERGSYGGYYADEERRDREREDAGTVGPGMAMGDTESGEFRGHASDDEGVRQREGSDLEDEDELRVQRSEEELRAGTREREAGSVNVRKRVRTDRERMSVPTRHEEVSVERVPVEGREAPEGEIGEDEVRMPVTEEEVVVEKRPVKKEEIRVRKDVVEGTETVEEDVRKEEVEGENNTKRGRRRREEQRPRVGWGFLGPRPTSIRSRWMSDKECTDGNTGAPRAEPGTEEESASHDTERGVERSESERSSAEQSDSGRLDTDSSDPAQDDERYRAVGPLTERDRREKQEEERKQREADLDTSWISVILGWITSLGATLILTGIVGGIVGALFGLIGAGSGAIASLVGVVVTLILAFLIGGYVAGRMASRKGVKHGIFVALLALILAIIAAVAGGILGASFANVLAGAVPPGLMQSIPTSAPQGVGLTAIISGVLALLAPFIGGALGGAWGAKTGRQRP